MTQRVLSSPVSYIPLTYIIARNVQDYSNTSGSDLMKYGLETPNKKDSMFARYLQVQQKTKKITLNRIA